MPATFFVMTVVLDKPNWLRRDQVRLLDRAGMTIGVHTWDHKRVTTYTDLDWPSSSIGPRPRSRTSSGTGSTCSPTPTAPGTPWRCRTSKRRVTGPPSNSPTSHPTRSGRCSHPPGPDLLQLGHRHPDHPAAQLTEVLRCNSRPTASRRNYPRCRAHPLNRACRCSNQHVTEKRHIAEVGAVALYGLIEELVRNRPSDRPESSAAVGPGAASKRDALTAVAELARAIEIPAQSGDLDPEQAHRMASLLLVIRDFVEPVGPDADEHVSRYLREFVGKLHR
jgi:polysaccharide deacetylase